MPPNHRVGGRKSVEMFPARRWAAGVVAGIVALGGLVVGSEFGKFHGATFHQKLVAWVSGAVVLVAGIISVARISVALGRLVAQRSTTAVAGAARVLSAVVGYVVVAFAALAELDVSIEHLLVGAGLAGVVLGIAAQQSLGNVFAGLVLLLARPFGVGDHIRIRSGALGGIFDAWVREMSLTYVTVETQDGPLKIPNSAMLAAGIGRLPGPGETDVGSAPKSGTADAGTAQRGGITGPDEVGGPSADELPGC